MKEEEKKSPTHHEIRKKGWKKKVRVSVQQVWKTIVNERHFLFGGVKKGREEREGGCNILRVCVLFIRSFFVWADLTHTKIKSKEKRIENKLIFCSPKPSSGCPRGYKQNIWHRTRAGHHHLPTLLVFLHQWRVNRRNETKRFFLFHSFYRI